MFSVHSFPYSTFYNNWRAETRSYTPFVAHFLLLIFMKESSSKSPKTVDYNCDFFRRENT